jgi:hypothetical protein
MLEDCVRPGGVVVASVMATVGSARYFLPAIEGLIDSFGIAHVDHEIATVFAVERLPAEARG